MSNTGIDPLAELGRELREAAPELVDWLEAELVTDYAKPNRRIEQIEDMGKKAHAFREKASTFAVEATKRFREHGFSTQAVVDFAFALDKSFDKVPECLEDVRQIWEARHKAEGVIDAVAKILSSDANPQAKVNSAKDGVKTSIEPEERLTLDQSTWTVTFDGKEFVIDNPRAFKVFQAIAKADGSHVSSPAIRKAVQGCNEATRIDVILKRLPDELRELIIGKPGNGSGYALRLPKKRVRNDAQPRAMKH
jgi:hypothetical protein